MISNGENGGEWRTTVLKANRLRRHSSKKGPNAAMDASAIIDEALKEPEPDELEDRKHSFGGRVII